MIDPSRIGRELEAVLVQRKQANDLAQQAANVIQQSIGAEKAFNSVLQIIKDDEAATAAAARAKKEADATARRAARQRKAKGAGK